VSIKTGRYGQTKATVWLTQQQIAQLFGIKQPAISKSAGMRVSCAAQRLKNLSD